MLALGTQAFELLREVKDYAIYMIDPEGTVLTWNDGARAIKGYSAAEIVGQHFSRFFMPEDRTAGRPARLLQTAREQGRVEDYAFRVRKDGTRFWANVVITAIHDEAGAIRGFVKVTRDLTERRTAEHLLRQSEERLRLLIEGVKDYAIYMLDPKGAILSWNAGAQRIKGYAAGEVLGRHFSMFYPEELRYSGHPERELQIAQETGRYEEEGVRVRKNGERFWANVVLTPVYEWDGGPLRGFAKVTRDLTERRAAEEAMRSASEQIQLERLRTEEAQNALRARDEFISVAAHELRTPLAALLLKIQGARAMVVRQREGDPASAPPKVLDRLESALGQIGRLTDLVQRLLDVSGIVRGKLVLRCEEASMSSLLRRVVDDLSDALAKAGCEVTVNAPGAASGCWDPSRIEQVLANLVSNALKYGAGRPIELRVEEDGDDVRVLVTDHGIGIRSGDMDRIFGRFERAVPLDNYSGLGLGLYIAKSIVEAHGGSIRVASAPGQPTVFTMQLPRRPAPAAQVSGSAVESSS